VTAAVHVGESDEAIGTRMIWTSAVGCMVTSGVATQHAQSGDRWRRCHEGMWAVAQGSGQWVPRVTKIAHPSPAVRTHAVQCRAATFFDKRHGRSRCDWWCCPKSEPAIMQDKWLLPHVDKAVQTRGGDLPVIMWRRVPVASRPDFLLEARIHPTGRSEGWWLRAVDTHARKHETAYRH